MRSRLIRSALIGGLCVMSLSASVSAQVTPAAAAPPEDTPAVRVGATIYTDYTYTQSPQAQDADGNSFHPSAFNVARSYININGNISHIVAFRVTPDVSRETNTASSLNGSLVFRIKYAYAQFNLDDWMARGSFARLGIQQTPYLDYEEGIYRYRFQGTMFVEREGYFASADAGASFHYNLANNHGDLHAGFFNGENYNKAEANDQKAFMIRGTVRPFANRQPILRGLRATAFYDADHYLKSGDRKRFIGNLTFEHKFVNAGFEYLNAEDQTSLTKIKVPSSGFSIWATPKSPSGWEALLRYDHLTPNSDIDSQTRTRTIVGISYWFPHQGTVTSALLLDYDGQTFDHFDPALPAQRRIALHALINF